MKKLGLVGGTGPESTIFYYRTLTQGVQDVLGVGALPPLVIDEALLREGLGVIADAVRTTVGQEAVNA